MAAPVYSNRLILEQGFGSGTPVPVLTCPEGYVTVIVCVNYVWGVNAGQVYATLQQQTTGAKFAAAAESHGAKKEPAAPVTAPIVHRSGLAVEKRMDLAMTAIIRRK